MGSGTEAAEGAMPEDPGKDSGRPSEAAREIAVELSRTRDAESIHEALQRQLRRLDASFVAGPRPRRSPFHQLAIPPPRKEPAALPMLPPIARVEPTGRTMAEDADRAFGPSFEAATDDRWATVEYEDTLSWSPLPEEERGAAWRARWPGLTAGAPALALAALILLAGGGGLFIGSQFAGLGEDETPAVEARAFAAEPAVEPPSVPSEPTPAVATKEIYDRVDPRRPAPLGAPPTDGDAAVPAVATVPAAPDLRRDLLSPGGERAATGPLSDGGTGLPGSDFPVAPERATPPAPAAAAPRVASIAPAGTTSGRIVRDVNLRTAPANSGGVIMIVRAGSQVDVYGCKFWCEIGVAGKRGYVYKDFVE